jgi:hypothetical protein
VDSEIPTQTYVPLKFISSISWSCYRLHPNVTRANIHTQCWPFVYKDSVLYWELNLCCYHTSFSYGHHVGIIDGTVLNVRRWGDFSVTMFELSFVKICPLVEKLFTG